MDFLSPELAAGVVVGGMALFAAATAEYDVAADFRRLAGGENYPGLIGRQAAGATNTRYTAFYNGTGWQLFKEVGGAWTSLGTVDFGSQPHPTPPRAQCPRTPEAPH